MKEKRVSINVEITEERKRKLDKIKKKRGDKKRDVIEKGLDLVFERDYKDLFESDFAI